MLKNNMGIPYRFICITDRTADISECETYPIWEFPQVQQVKPQNCYVRLKLFDPEIGNIFGERILNIDLDCVILKDLSPLISNHDFRAVRGVGAPLNGSMYMLKTGTNRHVWDSWDEKTSPDIIYKTKHNGRRISGSDQAWMSIQLPGAATWGPEDGVFQYSNTTSQDRINAKVVFFAGKVKPWDNVCKSQDPVLYNAYMSS
jgi:hypothetical protein